jgi:hypothetical protein
MWHAKKIDKMKPYKLLKYNQRWMKIRVKTEQFKWAEKYNKDII